MLYNINSSQSLLGTLKQTCLSLYNILIISIDLMVSLCKVLKNADYNNSFNAVLIPIKIINTYFTTVISITYTCVMQVILILKSLVATVSNIFFPLRTVKIMNIFDQVIRIGNTLIGKKYIQYLLMLLLVGNRYVGILSNLAIGYYLMITFMVIFLSF